MDDHAEAVMEDASAAVSAASAGLPQSADLAALSRSVEAVILTSDRPIAWRRLAEGLGLLAAADEPAALPAGTSSVDKVEAAPPKRRRLRTVDRSAEVQGQISAAIELLNGDYAASGRTFRIEQVAGGYRVMTLPELAPVLAAFHQARASHKLSKASIETLAVIAYRQPITRSHLEAIRGVNCGEVLRSLLERRLVTITGRAEELGRPMLYGTTREFLDAFGLASLKDLPSAADLQEVR